MNRFLDTCVVIGYCFPTHMFNDKCREIEQITMIWISDNVLVEWRKKERIVVYEHHYAMLEHINYIQLNYVGIINKDKKNILLSSVSTDIYNFMEIFYNKITFPISSDDLCDELNDIALGLRNTAKKNFHELSQQWIVHSKKGEYPDKENDLAQYAHEEDIYILIDAYDLSLKLSPKALTFLTTDEGMWKNRLEIRRILKTYEIRDLKRESALS
jgi:hypothetical protein